MKRTAAIIALVILSFILFSTEVFAAIPTPDTLQIQKARAYSGTNIETSDALFVIEYRIEYSTPPVETITEAYLCALINTNGTTVIKTNTPIVSALSNQASGYGDGICSIYLSAAEVTVVETGCSCTLYDNANFRLRMLGNPSFFATAPNVVTAIGGVTWRSNGTTEFWIEQDVGIRPDSHATSLTTKWGVTLVLGNELTLSGEDYFEEAIVNLRIMAPDIFNENIVAPNVVDRSEDSNLLFTRSYADTLEAFWEATSFQNTFADLATLFRIPETFMRAIIAFAVAIVFTTITLTGTGRGDAALMVFFVSLGSATLIGFIHLVFIAIIMVFATIIIAYTFILKGS